jgi:hypothetical protein
MKKTPIESLRMRIKEGDRQGHIKNNGKSLEIKKKE